MGELHTRMAASGVICADRTGLRTSYLPTLRQALTQPLVTLEKDGIEPVIQIMQVCHMQAFSHMQARKLYCFCSSSVGAVHAYSY